MKAIQIEEFGGPEAMKLVELPDPEPEDGQVVVDVARAGINWGDTHATRNDYLAEQSLPMTPGGEVSGTDPGGRRVAAMLGGGGYAQKVAVPEAWLVPIPDEVSDDQAAALLVQGVTAYALVHFSARLREGETLVVEAAAGGTGSLAVQIGKRAGARVIGLASSDEKRALVTRLGADAAVDSRSDDLQAAILEANDGKPVDAVLHMSGDAFKGELRTLAPFGRIVVFGNASRTPIEVSGQGLLQHSTAVIGFWLVHFVASRRDLVVEAVTELLKGVASGDLEVVIDSVHPLSEAAAAHEKLLSRQTTGKLLLDPSG